jgi:hypothetical protein
MLTICTITPRSVTLLIITHDPRGTVGEIRAWKVELHQSDVAG